VSAAAGKAHSLALAADGTLFSWGHGKSGQLGHSQLHTLVPFMAQHAIVVPAPQKVDELEPSRLESGKRFASYSHAMFLPGGDLTCFICRVTAISAAGNHSMVLTVNGRILAFGCNAYGQLGLGDTEDRWSPVEVHLKNKTEKRACIRAVQVVCGRNHSLALVSREGSLQACSTGKRESSTRSIS
jgi:E3 ubiquitin-protein ligase HERC3